MLSADGLQASPGTLSALFQRSGDSADTTDIKEAVGRVISRFEGKRPSKSRRQGLSSNATK